MTFQEFVIEFFNRDSTFSVLEGYVFNDNLTPLDDVTIRVKSYSTVTDSKGHFKIVIPIADQMPELPVKFEKSGYQSYYREDEVPGDNIKVILHSKK